MCGIAVAIRVANARAVVGTMAGVLAHRGPDDDGVCSLAGRDGVGIGAMGHRRLAIIDLSAAGNQPMTSANGRFTIVYNGEIYNYQTLRAELESDGVHVPGSGDTSVLLEGWARYGAEFLRRVEGMFAFALWDVHDSAVYLARDPFGIKPLYLAQVGNGVLAASEIRAILASDLVPSRVDRHAVASYLAFGSVPEPATIIDGIRAVPAGTAMRFRFDGSSLRAEEVSSVAPVTVATPVITERREAARVVRAALERSVDRHLVSDVPVAVFLSGGLDSSGLAALASQRASGPIDGFTVTFAERHFDESAVARQVAARYGIRHHEIPLGGADLLAALPDAFGAMDQPTLDGINTYVVSRAVRAHGTKVVLSGLGGDELFGGYPSFRRARALSRYARLPAPVKATAAHLASRMGGVRGAKVALGLRRGSPADAAYLASRTLFGDRQVADLCRDHAVALDHAPTSLTLLQRVSWRELTGYMRNTLLRDSDVFSMAHGLELRVPFIDREVASAAFSAADALKVSRGVTKPLLVAALGDLLPREVWDRPKQGFVLPFADWMRGPLATEVESALGDADRLAALGLEPASVRDVWTSFARREPGMTWSRPWALYSLVRWATVNGIEGLATREPALAGVAP